MKYLSTTNQPKLTIVRTNRKAVINEVADLITLYESTTKVELTLPSIWQGLKAGLNHLMGGLLLSPITIYAL